MKIKLQTLFERLSGSFWFLPSLMVVIAIIGAQATTSIDQLDLPFSSPALSWLYSGSPDGARSVLSTIAGSMISLAGLTFSITMVTLSLASSQLGPRLLSNFMRDRGNQIVLGTFISNFTYCLLVLRSIRSSEEVAFVPQISSTIAIVMAIVSLGVLIYFFHHVSTMIQAQNLIANIGKDLDSNIDRLLSSHSDKSPYEHELRRDDDIPADFEEKQSFIHAPASGYLQAIDYEELLQITENNDLILKLLYRPGDFIAKGSDMIAVYPRKEMGDVEDEIQDTWVLGTARLRIQDVEFFIDQLVEIAVRALSPGINDPFTAIACLDQLGTALSHIAENKIPSGYHYDEADQLRIISDVVTFEGIIDAAFNQIRQHGKSDVAVTIRLLEVIAIILARTSSDEQRQALLQQTEMIKRSCEAFIPEENDRQDVMKRYRLIRDIYGEEQEA